MGKVLVITECDFSSVALDNVTYEEGYKVTLNVSPTGGGTVAGGGRYALGESVTISATPSNGYKFLQWSDGSTLASRTITITGNAVYTAVFEALGVQTYGDTTVLGKSGTYGYMAYYPDYTDSANTFLSSYNANEGGGSLADGILTQIYLPFDANISYVILVGRVDQNGYFVETSRTEQITSTGFGLNDVSSLGISVSKGEIIAIANYTAKASQKMRYGSTQSPVNLNIAGPNYTTPFITSARNDGYGSTFYYTIDHTIQS